MKHFISKKIYSNRERGAAMLTAVIFFLVISPTVVLGIASPILKHVKITNDLIKSKESYYLAEGGLEDAIYRVKNGLDIVSGETITVNGYTTTLSITNTSSGRTLTAESDRGGIVRKMEARIIQGVGVAFNYGVQVGMGGFSMSNNAGVQGNVYSNGDISGSSGAYITGTAIAANTAALTANQVNETPATISSCTTSNCVDFRRVTGTRDFAQSFQLSEDGAINKVQLFVKKTGSPGNATIRIVTDSSGSPSATSLAQGTLSSSAVTTNFGWAEVALSSNPELTEGTTYWIVSDTGTFSSSNYYTIGANSSYGDGSGKIGRYNTSWQATSPTGLDMYFRVYLGGLTASISNVTVGTGSTGDAWAHTVTGSIIRGSLFCQSGSGNNKTCNTSQPDPAPTTFPISDANIAEWQSDAEAGGTHSGNYTVTSSSATLGPKKITGDLTLSNNATLTLTGTLYVQGNITLSNNSTIRLTSGYGSSSGVLLADGVISISNNGNFAGSGTTGSYLLVLTTSDCDSSTTCSDDAIEVSNNAGTVILNAQRGTINFSNNAGAKEATAAKISLSNNAYVIYESGLADVNFSSGPSGGWDITSWKEIE